MNNLYLAVVARFTSVRRSAMVLSVATAVMFGLSVASAPNASASELKSSAVSQSVPKRVVAGGYSFDLSATTTCRWAYYNSDLRYFLGTCTKFWGPFPMTKHVYNYDIGDMACRHYANSRIVRFRGSSGVTCR